jgi:hypothetical protein
MFSHIIEYFFENPVLRKIPVINSLVWTLMFLKPVIKPVAETLDFLLSTEKKNSGIKLI